jgi:hypothetical protein
MKNNKSLMVICTSLLLLISTKPILPNQTSQTTFIPRPFSENLALQNVLSNYEFYHNNYEKKPYTFPQEHAIFSLENVIFYGESTNKANMARYFLLGNKTELSVKENNSGDIGSLWLNLNNGNDTFSGTFKIRPLRRTLGTTVSYFQDFSKILPHTWLNLSLPIVKISHKLAFSETITGPKGTTAGITTIFDALNNKNWCYGKFASKRSVSGLDDINAKIGFNFKVKKQNHFGAYGFLILPTGTKPTAEYIFEPLIGNGHHVGLGLGFTYGWQILDKSNVKLDLLVEANLQHLYPAKELRSFDLKNGQWSRYLQVARDGTPGTPYPGINFFTKELKVFPRNNFEFLGALHYKYKQINVELGYNLWFKNSEDVELENPWDYADEYNIGIYDIQNGTISASTATINNANPTQDATFTRIQSTDLDLESAAQKRKSSQTVYLAAGLNSFIFRVPSLTGIGFSYEVADSNTAMSQWTVFFKQVFSF